MFSPDGQHLKLYSEKPLLAFDPDKDYELQKKEIRAKLLELMGDAPVPVDPQPVVTLVAETDRYKEYRIVFHAEECVDAVCSLALPLNYEGKLPLCVCMQGHTTGMHISLEKVKYPIDETKKNRNIAIQALSRGFAALCVEQRGMGERRTTVGAGDEPDTGGTRCRFTAMNALLLGRTLIRERCFDISRALDVTLELFPMIDGEKIICTGNSGGGTATYYASCLDERIKVSMPSCAVCTYKDSIGAMFHCMCNYIPGTAKYFDMGDLAILIAPRPLIVVQGDEDPIFPDKGVKEVFETIKAIYAAAGTPENCKLVTGHGGHRYYENEAWSALEDICKF